MLYDAAGFALAPRNAALPPELPAFPHFGFVARSSEDVRQGSGDWPGRCRTARRVSLKRLAAPLWWEREGRCVGDGTGRVSAVLRVFAVGGVSGGLEAVLVEFEEVVGGGEQPPFGSDC